MSVLETVSAPFDVTAFAAGCGIRPRLGAKYLERYRNRRLRVLLRHASANVPYYRALWTSSGVRWEDVRTVDDIGSLPITSKAVMRRLSRDSVLDESLDPAALLHHATSGSTGIPTHVWRTSAEERRLNLFRWRTLGTLGLRLGDRIAVVKLTTGARSKRFDRLQTAARHLGLVDRRIFDCFLSPQELLIQLERFRPHVLSGFARSLVRLARYLSGTSTSWLPRLVITGGERISSRDRQLLHERFQAPVHDVYGTTECNVIAFECPQTGGYHVCDDSVIVQICRDGVEVKRGEIGDVVVTSLHSLAMPLIRVQVGDRAIAGEPRCSCGSPFSTLQRIEGRVVDAFELPDGRLLHPFELTNTVMDSAGGWVAEFQIAQVLADKFVVRVVGSRQVEHEDVVTLRKALLSVLPSATKLDILQVEEIERDASGKLHYCRSLHRPAL